MLHLSKLPRVAGVAQPWGWREARGGGSSDAGCCLHGMATEEAANGLHELGSSM